MDEKKERKVADAVVKQLKGLSYHDAEQILIFVSNVLLKNKAKVE